MAAAPSASSTGNIIDSCSINTQALIRESIGEILRYEGLGSLERSRDDALRTIMPNEKEPMQFVLRQQQLLYEKCTNLLRRVRPELHSAIDELIDELEVDVFGFDATLRSLSPPTTKKPACPIKGAVTVSHDCEDGAHPVAPVAQMEEGALVMRDRARSATLAAVEQSPLTQTSPRTTGVSVGGSGSPPARISPSTFPQAKRNAPKDSPATPSKRAKTTAETPSKIVTLSTPALSGSRGKKPDQAKKLRAPENDEYHGAELDEEMPSLKELGQRAARKKQPQYEDKPIGDDEFL